MVPFLSKKKYTDKKIKPILQEVTPSLPKREPIDQDVSSSSHKKATDSLCPPEPNTPNKKRASSLPEKKFPDKKKASFSSDQMSLDKKNGPFSSEQNTPDEKLGSLPLRNNGLTGRRAIPFSMVATNIKGFFFMGPMS